MAEEVLLELQEIRKELALTRAQVETLNQRIEQLPVAGRADRAGAAGGAVDVAGLPVIGAEQATVAIVEFSDFECPYCAQHAREVFPLIKRSFVDTGKIRYYSRQFPLPFHSLARGAAVASLCAGQQGKYWNMREQLFSRKGTFNAAFYRSAAAALDLNSEKFMECLSSRAVAEDVEEDLAYGQSMGVSGTPKFFVGRLVGDTITEVTVVDGARSFDAFASVIDRKLSQR